MEWWVKEITMGGKKTTERGRGKQCRREGESLCHSRFIYSIIKEMTMHQKTGWFFSFSPIFQHSNIPLFRFSFGAAARTTAGWTCSAGWTTGAFKGSADGESASRHHPLYFLTFAPRAGNLFGGVENQLFKFVVALFALVFVNRHCKTPF